MREKFSVPLTDAKWHQQFADQRGIAATVIEWLKRNDLVARDAAVDQLTGSITTLLTRARYGYDLIPEASAEQKANQGAAIGNAAIAELVEKAKKAESALSLASSYKNITHGADGYRIEEALAGLRAALTDVRVRRVEQEVSIPLTADVTKGHSLQSCSAPAIGTTWSYRKHPERLYQVVYLANLAHGHVDHPATVVYRAAAHPAHIYTRTVDEFYRDFAPAESVMPTALIRHPGESRCVNALRSILSAGKPNLANPQYQALLTEGNLALSIWDNSGAKSLQVQGLLKRAESFISGFEGDEMQEGINELLEGLRQAINEFPASP